MSKRVHTSSSDTSRYSSFVSDPVRDSIHREAVMPSVCDDDLKTRHRRRTRMKTYDEDALLKHATSDEETRRRRTDADDDAAHTTVFAPSSPPAGSLTFVFVFALPNATSSPRPMKTRSVPAHWRDDIGCAKSSTEPRIVKNLRVVVKTEHISGPKVVTVRKMKFWRREEK